MNDSVIIIFGVTFIGVLIYFFPTFVAANRGAKHTLAIAVLNLFLGGTGLGWVAALVWAVADELEFKEKGA